MATFKTLVTDVGQQKITAATLNGGKVNIVKAAVGDGGGNFYTPTTSQTELKRETWRGDIAFKQINEDNRKVIDVKVIIPAEVGGFTVREAGLFDDEGDMIVVCNTPSTEKATVAIGSASTLTLFMHIIFSDMNVVNIKIEPTIDVVTHDEVAAMIEVEARTRELGDNAALEAFRQVRLNQESAAAELKAEAKAREDGDAKALADAKSYTNTQITEAVHMSGDAGVMMSPLGGLPEGTDIGGTDIRELLKKLLIKYVAPVVTLTATQSGGGVYELGTKINPIFTVTVTKKSRSITALGIYNGSSLLPSTLKLQPDGGSQAGVTLTQPITANASLKAKAGDGEGTGESAAIGYTFVDPFYYGAVSSAPTDSAGVRALTKLVQTKGAKTVSHTATVEAAKFCFAYPASYGPLTKIIDQNGFDNTADYDKSAVNVTNAAGSEVSYSVYTYKNNVSPGTMKMTYNF